MKQSKVVPREILAGRVRSRRWRFTARRFARGAFRLLGSISTSLCAAWAEALIRTPTRQHKTRGDLAVLGRGRREDLKIGKGRLSTWCWGDGDATVLLVHGWGGHAGRLARFVQPLVQAGFQVRAFDAPAHGDSDGSRASVPEFAEAIQALHAARGPFFAVIAHSLGAMATALALRRGLPLDRAVFLAPPADPDRYSRRFARSLGIPACLRTSMEARYQTRYQMRWQDLRIAEWAASYNARLLVFHDRRDATVPFHDGACLVQAWRGARLVETDGLGHHRILRDPDVIRRAVAFLDLGRSAAAPGLELEGAAS